MTLAALWILVRRDLRRTRGALFTSGFGITAGTAALIFFLALGLGVRKVLLGEVFPIDQIEIEAPKQGDPGLLGLLIGAGEPVGITEPQLAALAAVPGVKGLYPKLRFAFPSSGRGGKELFGYDVGTSELVGDGIDPALVKGELTSTIPFEDPALHPGPACADDGACTAPQYCERPSGATEGRCNEPVPVLVSRYLVEVFDKSLAPAHNLPPIGETLVGRAQGISFAMRLGESLLGKSRRGAPRTARVRVIGISRRAVDLGVTLPLGVVRRWNEEFSGKAAAERYSSAIVQVTSPSVISEVLDRGKPFGLEPRDTRARDVSVLITGVMALLSLVAGVILIVSASNIAYTFRVLVTERRAEIALYRALGATGADMRRWMMGLAVTVGLGGGAVGVLVARLLGVLTDRLAATKLPDFPFKPSTFFDFPPWLWGAGLGFAVAFALFGALGPARRASRVEPAAALSGS